MNRLKELADKLAENDSKVKSIDEQLNSILSKDNLTEDEQATHEKLVADRDALVAERTRTLGLLKLEQARLAREDERAEVDLALAEREKIEAEAASRKARLERRGTGRLSDPDRPPPSQSQEPEKKKELIPASVKRTGQVRNFHGVRNGMEAEERAYRFGMYMMSLLSEQMPHRFGHLKHTQEWVQKNMAAVGSNDASGYSNLIRPEFSSDIIDLREVYGVARRLFRVVPMMSDTKIIPRREGGLTAYAVGENAAYTESNKTWDDVTLTARKWGVISRASKEVNADLAISWGDDLAYEIAYAFADKEDDAGFNGDGTSTYHGIRGIRTRLQDVDGAGTDSAGLKTGAGNLWSELVLGDFDKVVGALPQYADRPETSWVCHRTFYYEVIEKLVQASGGVPAYEVRQGERRPRPLFKGYPVDFSQKFPSTEANSQVCITLGAYQLGAALGDRQQETIEFSDSASVGGQSLWERDQIGIKGTERMDIVVHDVGTSAAAGPIVGLQTASS